MQDSQMADYFKTRGFFDAGMISFEKPSDCVSLWQVLEPSTPERYFLSGKACAGILRRAERRGKELPPMLDAALRSAAGLPR